MSGLKAKLFIECQESATKDEEQAIGMLQAHFASVRVNDRFIKD